jgi:protein-S-isoprenylcysteine O-methyltransferase Ste14
MNKKVSRVEDLKGKLQKGDLTPKQAKKILHERGLGDPESWKWKVSGITSWAAYFILWLLPSLAKQSELEFFAQLPAFRFPMVVIYISLALLVTALVLTVAVHLLHQKWGGLKESGETIIFYRKGLFRIMRHPGVFGFMIGGIALPFLLGQAITFTPLTVVAIIIWVTFHYYTILAEEKINIEKWGEEYQKYMKEVPRFNFVLGLWRLRERT